MNRIKWILVVACAMTAFVGGLSLMPVGAQAGTSPSVHVGHAGSTPEKMPRLTPNTSSPVHISTVGYDCCGSEYFEHIHICDTSASNTDISGWKIYSPYTGDTFTFPNNITAKDCVSDRPAVSTYYNVNADNTTLFCWCWPWPDPNRKHDEWPDGVGVRYSAYLYDASNNLISLCYYIPQGPSIDGGDAKCASYYQSQPSLIFLPFIEK